MENYTFEQAASRALNAHFGHLPMGTGFLSHANHWELWEHGELVASTDIEEEAENLWQAFVAKWLKGEIEQ